MKVWLCVDMGINDQWSIDGLLEGPNQPDLEAISARRAEFDAVHNASSWIDVLVAEFGFRPIKNSRLQVNHFTSTPQVPLVSVEAVCDEDDKDEWFLEPPATTR